MGKKKTLKTAKTSEKPFLQIIVLDGEAILRQTQVFAREFQKRIGNITDG